jgi:hypothetical protein
VSIFQLAVCQYYDCHDLEKNLEHENKPQVGGRVEDMSMVADVMQVSAH